METNPGRVEDHNQIKPAEPHYLQKGLILGQPNKTPLNTHPVSAVSNVEYNHDTVKCVLEVHKSRAPSWDLDEGVGLVHH